MIQFKDKVVLITGCSSGIGLSTTKSLLELEAKVFGIDINPAPELLGSSPNFAFQTCNIAKQAELSAAVEACAEKFGGRIDVLLNVAGITDAMASADTVTDEDYERVIAINLTAPIKLMKNVLPYMKKQKKGTIVNVASKAGLSGGIAGVAYTASKHGLLGATKNVAWRFHDDGIRCNAVCPGAVPTNIGQSINTKNFDVEGYAKIRPMVEMHLESATPKDLVSGTSTIQAPVPPEDIANAVLFLASDASSSISGVSLPVDKAWDAA